MSDDVRGNALRADEPDWQDEETGIEDDEYFDEDDLDPTRDDLAVIGPICTEKPNALSVREGLLTCAKHAPFSKRRVY